jgi:hypothetical protein
MTKESFNVASLYNKQPLAKDNGQGTQPPSTSKPPKERKRS